jgi:hypothetical protein
MENTEKKSYRDMTDKEQALAIVESQIYHWRHLEKAGVTTEEKAKRNIGALQFIERYLRKIE